MVEKNIRTRPALSGQNVANGTHVGKIASITFKTEPNKYNNNEPQEVFYIEVSIQTPAGTVKLRKRVPYVETWSEKSNMFKLLRDLDCLPEPGEKFNFNGLVGMDVTVSVMNNTQGDRTYSNITQMLPCVAKKEPRKLERKVQKVDEKPVGDADFDFGDFSDDLDDNNNDDKED